MGARIRRALRGRRFFLATLVGNIPSHALRRLAYRHVFGASIGRATTIHWQARFFHPSGVRIGDHCVIGNGAFLDGRHGLTIGDCVVTGAEIMVYTAQHDIDSPSFAAEGGPVTIGNLVYLGPRVIILPQVRIGEGAVVCAGCVVTHDVDPYTVVCGVPARFIRYRSTRLDYLPDFEMPFQ